LLVLVGVVTSQSIISKQLAGPPSEFGLHAIPSPIPQALTSASARLNINVWSSEVDDTKVTWQSTLPIDSIEGFQFSVFAPSNLITTISDPSETLLTSAIMLVPALTSLVMMVLSKSQLLITFSPTLNRLLSLLVFIPSRLNPNA